MNKELKVFISIVVILIIVAGAITVNQIFEPKSANVPQLNAETASVIDEEGQIYIIGQHLFTDATEYLSTQNILTAAKTIEGLDIENMTNEEILNSIIIYARDAENNWINAMTGDKITFSEDFEFDIKYIDLVKVPTGEETDGIAEVETEEELEIAILDNNIHTIEIKQDIDISSGIFMKNREITINLNGYKLRSSEDTTGYALGNALFTIADSYVIFNGHGTISGNGFDGGTIFTLGSSVELNNVTVSGEYGLVVTSGEEDDLGVSNSSVIKTKNSIFSGKTSGIYFSGLGTVDMSNCTVRGDNGNAVSVLDGDTISNDMISGNERLTITNNNGSLELTIEKESE